MKIYKLAEEMGYRTKDFMQMMSEIGISDKKTHLNKVRELFLLPVPKTKDDDLCRGT